MNGHILNSSQKTPQFDLSYFSQTTVSGFSRTVLRFTGSASVSAVVLGVEPNLFWFVLRYLRAQRVAMRIAIPTMAPTVIRTMVNREIY